MTINPALINLQNPKLNSIRAEDVAGYRIIRSFFNKTLFNVHAVNAKNDLLVCVSADMDFDTASALVETLNAPHELELLHELQETELVEVKVKTEDRIFTALRSQSDCDLAKKA